MTSSRQLVCLYCLLRIGLVLIEIHYALQNTYMCAIMIEAAFIVVYAYCVQGLIR
jgi:hypothetical protein